MAKVTKPKTVKQVKPKMVRTMFEDEQYEYKTGGKLEDEPRVYIADLAAYNDGKLVGEWINLSDWEEVDINKPTPKGYKRYIEKRKGRDIPGHKKSEWIHDENAEFVRNYASKNPKEDFADTFAFVVLGKEFNFKGNGNKKIEIIKDYLR